MKLKSSLLLILFICPSFLFSQTDSISMSCCKKSQLPEKKTVMLELNFNPFSSAGVFSFDNLQTKYWMNDHTVLRLGLKLSTNGTSLSDDDYDSKELHKSNVDEKSLLIGIKPGIEFRFLPKSKISPYAGFEIQYENKSVNSDYKDYIQSYDYNTGLYSYEFVETKINGALRNITSGSGVDTQGYSYSYTLTNYAYERAFSSIGANLIAGSDFYFVKNMYFGFEVGLGYESTKYSQVILDISTDVTKTTMPSYTTNSLGFYYNSAIRFGVWF